MIPAGTATYKSRYVMKCLPLLLSQRYVRSLLLSFVLLCPGSISGASTDVAFSFENAELATVIKKVGEFTNTPFLFDPELVKGKITLLAPQKVSPEGALALLQSAVTLRGYRMVRKEEGIWIVPAGQVPVETIIEVVPLQYARAEELADTLSWVAPAGVRIVPYSPTNSLLISGDPKAVQELLGVIGAKEKKAGQ
jgi:general secretion pathway protein D